MKNMPNASTDNRTDKITAENYEERRRRVLEMIDQDAIAQQSPAEGGIVTTILDKHVPTVKKLAGSALDTGSKISSALSPSVHAAQSVSSGFQIGSLALSALNSVRIPALYLLSWFAGEKPPVTLSNNARWAYSALLVGLSVLALTVPVTAAPIAMTLSTLGLGASVFALGSFFYKRYQLPKALKRIDQQLEEQKAALQSLKETLKEQKSPSKENMVKLQQAEQNAKLYENNIKNLTAQKQKTETALKAHGIGAFVDKSVGVGLSAMAMAGIALSLFFPAAGLTVLAVASGLGGLYVASRVAIKIGLVVGKYVKQWQASKKDNAAGARPEQSPKSTVENNNALQNEQNAKENREQTEKSAHHPGIVDGDNKRQPAAQPTGQPVLQPENSEQREENIDNTHSGSKADQTELQKLPRKKNPLARLFLNGANKLKNQKRRRQQIKNSKNMDGENEGAKKDTQDDLNHLNQNTLSGGEETENNAGAEAKPDVPSGETVSKKNAKDAPDKETAGEKREDDAPSDESDTSSDEADTPSNHP